MLTTIFTLWRAKSGHAFSPGERTLDTIAVGKINRARTEKGGNTCTCVEPGFINGTKHRGFCSVANAGGSPLPGGQGFPDLAGLPEQLFLAAPSLRPWVLLPGTMVNRTYGTHKNIYVYPCLLTTFGPIYYGPSK